MGDLIDVLTDISMYFSLFYPILFFRSFKEGSRALKIFTIYLIGIAIIQFLQIFTRNVLGTENNLYLFVYYFVFQFVALSFFYYDLLRKKWILYITVIALLFFVTQYILDPGLYFRYNSTGVVVAQGLSVLFSLFYFYKLLSEKGEFLIVNIGIFFYLLSSMLIFASGNLVLDIEIPKETIMVLSNINNVLYFGFQVLIVIEWWKNYSSAKVVQ